MICNPKGLGTSAPNAARTRIHYDYKYNTHHIYRYIYIYIYNYNYSIKNYYVNSYLTTCMAQSIKLVSCNNNNKDTTIYLLVSLSSFSIHVAYYFAFTNLLIYSSSLLFFSFSPPTVFLYLWSPCYYIYIPKHTSLHLILDKKDWKFQISIDINRPFSILYYFFVLFNIIIMYK